jgi:hypothetical protein
MSHPGPFKPPKPNVAFKDGKLYVFASNRVSVLRGWPDMAAWTRSLAAPQWCRFRPHLDVSQGTVQRAKPRHRFRPVDRGGRIRPVLKLGTESASELDSSFAQQQRAALDQFLRSFPPPLMSTTSGFAARHWHLMSMAARCPGAEDFLQEHPALAFGLASCWTFGAASSGSAMRWIRSTLPLRRRTIAARLGFPETDRTVRILGKVAPSACSVWALLGLRVQLSDPDAAKQMAHLAVLDLPVVACLCVPRLRRAITPSFLAELGNGSELTVERACVPGLLADFLLMQRQLDDSPSRPLHSVSALVRAHDSAALGVKKAESRKLQAGLTSPFPSPPLHGNSQIEPLSSTAAILEEAEEQENCVASKLGQIHGGAYYVYRMHAPERATLALELCGGSWRLSEIAAARNRPVTSAAFVAAAAWLADAGIACEAALG